MTQGLKSKLTLQEKITCPETYQIKARQNLKDIETNLWKLRNHMETVWILEKIYLESSTIKDNQTIIFLKITPTFSPSISIKISIIVRINNISMTTIHLTKSYISNIKITKTISKIIKIQSTRQIIFFPIMNLSRILFSINRTIN